MTLKRLPFFELTILVVMGILGWTAFTLYNRESVVKTVIKTLADDGKESKKMAEDSKKIADKASKESEAMQKVYQQLQEAFRRELSPEQADIMETMLKLSEALQIQGEYFSIADHLKSTLGNLHKVLSDGVSQQNPKLRGLFEPPGRELGSWLTKKKDLAEAGRFKEKSQDLKARMEKWQLSSTNGPISITQDLGTLVNEIGHKYSNYLAEAELVLKISETRAPRWDIAQTRLERAGITAQELFGLAERARADGEAAKSFQASQSQSESIKRLVSQQKALTLLSNSQSAVEFMRRAGISSQADDPGNANSKVTLLSNSQSAVELTGQAGISNPAGRPDDSNSQVPDPSLQPARYGVLIALAGLAVFLIGAIYRRMVVAPLHLKLAESETMNKLAHFGQLAAGLAHEIRNPLTAIGARLHTLQKGLAEGSPEFQDASIIRNEMRRLDRIVKEFLTLARPAEPKLVPMSAGPLLKKTRELLASQFETKSETQSVQLTVGPVAEGQFRGDEPQLKQVLINLIQNAAESMEDKGGPIVLRARKDRAKLNGRETDAIIIEVEDAGPGIPPEIQQRLFDPFFSTKEHGTGLGLAIAARIVDKHGGALTFDTHLNRGTTFGIVLPLYDTASDATR